MSFIRHGNAEKFQLTKCIFLKDGKGFFDIFSSAGAHLEANLQGAICLLGFHGSSDVEEVALKLHDHGYAYSRNSINRIKNKFVQSGIIYRCSEVVDYFDVSNVIMNVTKFSFGACSLCELTMSVTDKCSFDCDHCYRVTPRERPEVSLDLLTQCIVEAKSLGALSIGLTGGEPWLALDRVTRLAETAYGNGFRHIAIFLRDIMRVTRYLDLLAKSGINELRISLDARYSINDYVGFISQCRKYGFRVVFNVLLHSSVFQKLIPYLNGLHSVADNIRVSPYIPFGKLPLDEYDAILGMYTKIAELYSKISRLECSFFFDVDALSPMICDAGMTFAHIETDGYVYGCPALINVDAMGNINDASFLNIWKEYNGGLRQIRDINDCCKGCEFRVFCIGRCRAMSYAKFKTISVACEEDTYSRLCKQYARTRTS